MLAAVVGACSVIVGDESVQGTDPRLGGDATVQEAGDDAFRTIAPAATPEEKNVAAEGLSVFLYVWTPDFDGGDVDSETASFNEVRDGLGPTSNARDCVSCHIKNGSAPGPEIDGDAHPGLVLRPSLVNDDGTFGIDPRYNQQIQTHALNGVPPEASVGVTWEETEGTYDDGTPYTLRSPVYDIEPNFGDLEDNTVYGVRIAPHMAGTGLLEAIPAEDLEAAADPDDTDGDGISGRVAEIAMPDGEVLPGRFGWKAVKPHAEDQVAAALWFDNGITSRHYPYQNCPVVQVDCLETPDGSDDNGEGPDVEIVDNLFDELVLYVRLLGVPEARFDADGVDRDEIDDGARTFEEIGCASCHSPTQNTGDADSPAFADQTIHPFTDLLLHDLGEGLAEERPEGDASGAEWRTAPLWGIGLRATTSGGEAYLHDGRARTLAEAILWHGGEGQAAADAFRSLDEDQRKALLAYLGAL